MLSHPFSHSVQKQGLKLSFVDLFLLTRWWWKRASNFLSKKPVTHVSESTKRLVDCFQVGGGMFLKTESELKI